MTLSAAFLEEHRHDGPGHLVPLLRAAYALRGGSFEGGPVEGVQRDLVLFYAVLLVKGRPVDDPDFLYAADLAEPFDDRPVLKAVSAEPHGSMQLVENGFRELFSLAYAHFLAQYGVRPEIEIKEGRDAGQEGGAYEEYETFRNLEAHIGGPVALSWSEKQGLWMRVHDARGLKNSILPEGFCQF